MKKTLKEYAVITFGCALFALGFCWCCVPAHLSIGGFTGIAQVLNLYFPALSVGVTTLVMNVPLFLLGLKLLGKRLLVSSLYAMAVSSLMIDGLNALYAFPAMDPVLAAVFGGVLCGAASGFMLRQGATTGGTELGARLLKLKFESISIGTLCLMIDVLVTFGYALIFRDMTRALYGVIALYVSSLLMDKVVYGPNAAKMAYIISPRHEQIAQRLLELDLGVTLLDGTGAYNRKPTEVILCAFSRNYIIPVKKLVQQIDPDAFIIVCDTHEILGEGFGKYDPMGL